MEQKQFSVLYTGQKAKKAKTFHDGVLVQAIHGSRVHIKLLDDENVQLYAGYVKRVCCKIRHKELLENGQND